MPPDAPLLLKLRITYYNSMSLLQTANDNTQYNMESRSISESECLIKETKCKRFLSSCTNNYQSNFIHNILICIPNTNYFKATGILS